MAIFDQANWRGPIPNKTPGGMLRPFMGLILHVEQGSESGSDSWFHNPGAQASAHFGNPKSGKTDQWVDTSDKAWAEASGNSRWISIEHEGFAGQSITATQIENDAQLYAWLHKTENVPLQLTDNVGNGGIGWHGMGGQAWGGHLDCPGDPIKNARPAILHRVGEILGNVNTSISNKGAAMANTPNAVAAALNGSMTGVWVAASDGGVFSYGKAGFHGSLGGQKLAAPIVDILSHGDNGYYLLGADGGVFTFGDAPYKGSYTGLPAADRQGSRTFLSIQSNSKGGYSLLADDGAHYDF